MIGAVGDASDRGDGGGQAGVGASEAGVFSPRMLGGTTALVTGGGTGLGKATALELVRCGACVTIAGRREDVLAEAAGEIRALVGEGALGGSSGAGARGGGGHTGARGRMPGGAGPLRGGAWRGAWAWAPRCARLSATFAIPAMRGG